MSERLVLGVDPGVTGGLFWLSEDGTPVRQETMPVVKDGKRNVLDVLKFIEYVADMTPALVVIERQQAFGRGSSKQIVFKAPWRSGLEAVRAYLLKALSGGDSPLTAFSVGQMYGALKATCMTLGLRTEIVGARHGWQKIIFAGMGGGPKDNALAFVQYRFPGHDFAKSARASKQHSGIVDAACISEFGRRCLL